MARTGHSRHVFRVAWLFAAGFGAFLLVRQALVPDDFGVYGFYRAGALDDNRNRPVVHAGEAVCLDCHSSVDDVRKPARHRAIRCEACHGPLSKHASGDFEIRPRALNPRQLCLACHVQQAGKPAWFPQIVPADHAGDGPCTECHQPHRPSVGRPRP